LKKIIDLIDNNQNFVITSHVNPDGDSIGSEIALYNYLKNLKKTVRIINYSETPQNYIFLDKNCIIENYSENNHNQVLQNSDVIFILDTNEYARLRTMAEEIRKSKAKKVCIDHHLGETNSQFDYSAIDVESPSTGEILYKLFTYNGNNSITQEIAVPLYAAIMTDTGSFRFPRTDSETHRIAAVLLECGADPVTIYKEVYEKSKIGRLKLLSRFLNNIKLAYDDKVIYAPITLKEFEETGTNVLDTEGFSHHMLSLDSAQMGIIFTETKKGVKISFRSRGNVNVNEFAKEFGGGGHQNAAGAWMNGAKMEEVIGEVISKAKKFIK
jgi:bifunctional oligoribonuclease and PAP phosphatase NrnA